MTTLVPDQLITSTCYPIPIQGEVGTQGRLATRTHRGGVGPECGHSWRPILGVIALIPDQLMTSTCYPIPNQGKVDTQGKLATRTHRGRAEPKYGHSWRPVLGVTTLTPAQWMIPKCNVNDPCRRWIYQRPPG